MEIITFPEYRDNANHYKVGKNVNSISFFTINEDEIIVNIKMNNEDNENYPMPSDPPWVDCHEW